MYLIHDEEKPYDLFYFKATEPLQGESSLFTIQFPGVPGTQLINLGRMKGWVDLAATQLFWTEDPWIGTPAPLGHYSMNWGSSKNWGPSKI